MARVDVSEDVDARLYAPDLGEESGTPEGEVEVGVWRGVGYEDVGGEGDAGGPWGGGGVVLETGSGVSGGVFAWDSWGRRGTYAWDLSPHLGMSGEP